ncbi:TPA: Veg family protein [Streptococcus suis]
MSDAFTDVAKMKQIKQDIKDHEGQIVELTLENGRKREKNQQGRITEVYQSLFIVEFEDPNNTFVESYTYSDVLTEKILIHYLD